MQNYTVPKQISKTIFRAYDIRGIVGQTITNDIMYVIGLAVGSEALARGQTQIIMARDERYSSHELGEALQAGLLDSGCNVIDIGYVPTPVLYYATKTSLGKFGQIPSGVMLTASHNPKEYNGLKMVIANQTLSQQEIEELYQRILKRKFNYGQGQLFHHQVQEAYISEIKSIITLDKPLKIVIDCGNSVVGHIAPQLFRTLGCEVVELYCDVDGYFPNHEPDPSQAANLHDLIHAVRAEHADLGLAFDGDGDRLGVVTETGEIICPDRQLMLFAKHVLLANPGATIIFDVKCTRYLAEVIKQFGGVPLMYKTGHSFIKAKMQQEKAALAGEMSGHIFFAHRWYGFDDGLYTGARLLEIVAQGKATVGELFNQLPKGISTEEVKIPIADEDKQMFMKRFIQQANFANAELNILDGLRAEFADGWGLIRVSNTSPYLVGRFEGDNFDAISRIQGYFREQLLGVDKNLQIDF